MIKLCKRCGLESEFGKNKISSGINGACKKCQIEYRLKVKKEKEDDTFIPFSYQKSITKTKEEHKKRYDEWRIKNKEGLRIKQRNWEHENSEKLNKDRVVRLNKIREIGIIEYGGRCQCCGDDKIEFLTIDHINGRMGEKKITGKRLWSKLKTQGWPKDNIQLLCWNCNCAKGVYGQCPHQEGK